MNSTTKPTIIPDRISDQSRSDTGLLARLARSALLKRLEQLQDGEIRLQDPSGAHRFGARTARCGLSVTIQVRDPEFYSLAAYGGTVGAGESTSTATGTAMTSRRWCASVLNRHVMEGMESGLAASSTRSRARAALGQPQQPPRQRPQHRRPL
jgi:hypothetical protein